MKHRLAEALRRPVIRPRAEALSELLCRQQERWGDRPTAHTQQALIDGRPLLVTGQQCGLLGGPALVLWKLLGMLRLADDVAASGSARPLCVFWMEANDHDWAEAATPGHPFANGLPLPDEASRGKSVGRIRPGTDWWRDQSETLALPAGSGVDELPPFLPAGEDSLTEGFARFLRHLVPTDDLLLLDPSDPGFRAFATPFFEKLHAARHDLLTCFAEDTETMVRQGRKPPVQVDDAAPWFMEDEAGRRRRPQIGEALARPESLSANVLSRPLLQDDLLRPAATVLGPTEALYHRQIQGARSLLGIPEVIPVDRPHLQLIRSEDERRLVDAGANPWLPPQAGDPWPEEVLSRFPEGGAWQQDRHILAAASSGITELAERWIRLSGRKDLGSRATRIGELIDQLDGQLQVALKGIHKSELRLLHDAGAWQDGSRGTQERRVNAWALLARMGGQGVFAELRARVDPIAREQQRFVCSTDNSGITLERVLP